MVWLGWVVANPEVFWHARPAPFWREIIHSNCLAAVIDLSACDGTLALVCAREAQIPYLGFCLTDIHKSALRTQLIKTAMEEMVKETDNRYDPNLAKALKSFSTKKVAGTAAADNSEPKTKKAHLDNAAEDGPDAEMEGREEAKKDQVKKEQKDRRV